MFEKQFEYMTCAKRILTHSNSDTFQFWRIPILTVSNSDTFRFWHFLILTLSKSDTSRFWHFPILTLSSSNTIQFLQKWTKKWILTLSILTLSNPPCWTYIYQRRSTNYDICKWTDWLPKLPKISQTLDEQLLVHISNFQTASGWWMNLMAG